MWNLSFRWAFGNKDIHDTVSHTPRTGRSDYMELMSLRACSPRTSCTWWPSANKESCQLLLNHREVLTAIVEVN